MTLYEFNTLNDDGKYDAISSRGVLIGDRRDSNYRHLLYQIDSFYVEGKSDIKENKIVSIRSFLSDVPLQPYLDQIDLQDLK